MLKLALAQKPIRVVNDQFGTPTWAYRLALQIQNIIETNIKGTFHVTGENSCSWFDLASYFLKRMNISHNIKPCTTQEYPTLAKRPANSILENQRLKALKSNIMLNWKDDIDQFVDQLSKSGAL
jgi:dTDP-4-dehydrorhamnose reductase